MDTIVIVFEFCSPRDLLSIASTSQELSKRVTYTHVLRSSLMRGGPFYKASLEVIFKLCRKGSIFIPSPMRLLHLVNTRRCEIQGCSTKVKSVNVHFGLSLCYECSRIYSVESSVALNWDTTHVFRSMESTIKDRIASQMECFYFAKDYSQGGERNGPVITVQTMNYLRKLPDKTFTAALENFLHTIPRGPKTFFDNYDKILPESITYHAIIEQRKREALEKKISKKKEKFEVIKDTILNKLSGAPWSNHVENSTYFIKATEGLRHAPSKATKKALQAIVNDIRPKFDALFVFLTMDFLFDTTQNSNNQLSNNYNGGTNANSEGNVLIDVVRRERSSLSLDVSFEISLKEYFNQKYPDNRIYAYISERQLDLISKFHFHEAIVDIINVKAMFAQEVEYQYEEHRIARIVFDYVSNKKYSSYKRDLSDGSGLITGANDKLLFSFYKSVYCEAKLYYPILYSNITEYISLSWLKDEDRDEESYRDDDLESEDDDDTDYRRLWNGSLDEQLHTIWTDLDTETIDWLIIKNYVALYKIDCELATQRMS